MTRGRNPSQNRLVKTPKGETLSQDAVLSLLSASGPAPEHAAELMLYGQFVGSWHVESTWFGAAGNRTGTGEWHFAWVLGGRGVQDVLFGKGAPRDRYGTTLRCYDPSLDAWHVAWMCPGHGEFANLVGRRREDRIVQEGRGLEPGRLLRWSFTEITPHSFVWLGEASVDGGATWSLEQEMKATRTGLAET